LQHVLTINNDARVTKHKIYTLKKHKIYTNEEEKMTSIKYLNNLFDNK